MVEVVGTHFREIFKNFRNFRKFIPKLWRHLTTNFKLIQAAKKDVSCSENRRKLRDDRLINGEDTPTWTSAVQRHTASTAGAWQNYKKTRLSYRRTFIYLHQTLHADRLRVRHYHFCHKQLLLDPIPNFCAGAKTHFLGFLVPKYFFVINP